MRIGSLFSGIGGLELGLTRAGVGRVAWQVEIDPYCRAVLAHHWPDAQLFDDVHHVGAHNLSPVDVICGGFPCPPVSIAGKRLGRRDPRWLWPEFARIVRELRPRFVVVENPPGLLSCLDDRGCSLAGDVLGALAAIGYDAEWRVLSAGDMGSPQERERVFIVAYAPAHRRALGDGRHKYGGADESRGHSELVGSNAVVDALGDASGAGREERQYAAESGHAGHAAGERGRMGNFWADTLAVRGADGTVRRIPREAAEAGPGSALYPVADGLPGRVAQLGALGNAVVPQCAEVVGRRLLILLNSQSQLEEVE